MTQAPQPSPTNPQAQALADELYAVLRGRTLSPGLVLSALDLIRDRVSRRRAARSYKDPALSDLEERTRQAVRPSPEIKERMALITGRRKGKQ